ncbi:carboxypeptidase-like regulatory domain-containing protein [Sphingopyxis sp.]|uniref:carboxypeptidase-like regulatory domain-containing protein n=1 Tax=Sphingopyxis sp. TaxID=1908224 RepID=UPI0032ED0E48
MSRFLFAVALLFAAPAAVQAQTPVKGAVQGQVADEQGRPVADAEVTARYQSNPGGVSISRSARTDRQGRYRIHLPQPPGVWTAHAKATLNIDSTHMTVDLVPDNSAPFAGNAGAVRNFRLRFAEQTTEDAYGVGGMLVVNSAIGDYTPLNEVTVTLHPVGGGSPIEKRLRSTGEGWVVTGLRPVPYRVTASHRGRPMMVSMALTPQRDYAWRASVTSGFERTGPGIYQLRIEVRSR